MVYGAHAEVYGAHAEPQPRMLVECPDESRPHTQAVEGNGYALHEARENDSVPDARVCNHDCGHGGSCDLRTSLGPIFLGRSGWLGRSKVGGWGWGGRSSGGWGDRYPSERHYRRSPHRDFLSPFSGERRNRPAPTADYSKAPPPRKLETPPSQTAVVIGDSMADWLGYGLDESYAEQPEIGVERKIRATSGLVRYDAKNEALDWPQAAQDALL